MCGSVLIMWTHKPGGNATIRAVDDPREVARWVVPWLAERATEVLGIDCESNAVDPFDTRYRLRAVQMADPYESWVLDAQRLGPDVLRPLVAEHDFWTAHFSEADIRFLHRGVPGSIRVDQYERPHVADTQPVLAWYDPRTVTSQDDAYGKIPLPKGLKQASARVLGHDLITHWEGERDAMAANNALPGMRRKADRLAHWFASTPFEHPTYQIYSGLDPLAGIRMWHVMTDELKRRGQWPGVVDDLNLQWWIDLATLRGMPFDPRYAIWLDGQLEAAVDLHTPELARYGINPSGMGAAVGEALTHLGAVSTKIRVDRDTGEQKWSWDKHVLAELIGRGGPAGDLAARITAVRKATKFRSAYVKPMLDAITRDQRLHPSMRAVGTITTRQSAARPPVQQLPKKDPRVRAAIIAPPGWALVACDLSQGEPRTMAALSGDRALLAELLAGDLNSAAAAAIYGDVYDPAHGKEAGTPHYLMRNQGKAGFLACCYGAQDRKLTETLIVAGPMVVGSPRDGWRAKFPDLFRLSDDLNARSFVRLENGWVAPLWDRMRMTDDGRIVDTGRPSRKGLNYATQGTQRQLLAKAVRQLVAWGWGPHLLMLIHDEVLLLVPFWMAEQARDALAAAMTMEYRGVPIECEAEICGSTWLPQPEEFDASVGGLLGLAVPDDDDLP